MNNHEEYYEELVGEFVVECKCGWIGKESELVTDFYDSHNMSNPLEDRCPICGGYVE